MILEKDFLILYGKVVCSMRKYTFLFGVACLLILLETSHAANIIRWNEAHKYYGQWVTVEGKIISTENTGKVCFLNFGSGQQDNVVVLIFRSSFHRFPPDPQDYYYGKEVLVTGKIQKYKGIISITIPDKSRIKVVENDEKKAGEKGVS